MQRKTTTPSADTEVDRPAAPPRDASSTQSEAIGSKGSGVRVWLGMTARFMFFVAMSTLILFSALGVSDVDNAMATACVLVAAAVCVAIYAMAADIGPEEGDLESFIARRAEQLRDDDKHL